MKPVALVVLWLAVLVGAWLLLGVCIALVVVGYRWVAP